MVVMKKNQRTLSAINDNLATGMTFAESVKDYINTDLYYQLMLAEKHGELIDTLDEIGTLLVTKQKQRRKLQQLLQYPLILLFLLGLLVVGLSAYVFPELSTWQNGDQGPSLFTLIKQWFPLVASGIAMSLTSSGIVLAIRWKKSDAQSRVQWLCGLPILGKCYQLYYGYYVTSTIATMLQSGMSLKEILAVVEFFSEKSLLNSLGQSLQQKVSRGGDIQDVIKSKSYLPDELSILVNKGSTMAELGDDMAVMAKLQFKRLIEQLEGLLSLVQPIIFVVIALVIVFLYLSILLPIYHSVQGAY